MKTRIVNKDDSKLGINTTFFDSWSYDMAYILGYLTLKGNILERAKNRYTLELSSKDGDVVKFIRDNLKPSQNINYYRYGYNKSKKLTDRYNCKIISNTLIESLFKIGYLNKDLTRNFDFSPPKEYFSDYFRGIHDSQGGFHSNINKKGGWVQNTWHVNSKYEQFLRNLQVKIGNIGKIYHKPINKDWNLVVSKTADLKEIYQQLYSNVDSNRFYLKRKKRDFDKIYEQEKKVYVY